MGKLPLTDPRWLAMRAEIDQREKQTGDLGLTIQDLQRDLEAGKRHSMRRNRRTGESELLHPSYWKTHFIGYVTQSSVIICRQTDIDRHKTDEYGNPVAERLDDWLFFVWQPDRVRPTKQPKTAHRRKARKTAGGRPPKFTADQQQWLQENYSSDLKAEPRLAKHDAAVPHVTNLAKTKFGIDAGRKTLLQHIVRPVLKAAKNSQ